MTATVRVALLIEFSHTARTLKMEPNDENNTECD
jgi:hypothetical protein